MNNINFLEGVIQLLYPLRPAFVTGIDWGIRYPAYAFTSYGTFYPISQPNELYRYVTFYDKEIAKARCWSRKRRERLQNEKINFLQAVNNRMSDFIIRLCPQATTLAIEDQPIFHEDVHGPYKIHHNETWTQTFLLKDLYNKILEKAKYRQVEVMYIDRYITSITCPRCGYVDSNNRHRHEHIFVCDKCGLICNDDGVAAWNVHNKAFKAITGRDFQYSFVLGGIMPVILTEREPISIFYVQ